jgi:hypothetical protein
VLIDKREIVKPRHEGKADGGGEAFPKKEKNSAVNKRSASEQRLDRQILFFVSFRTQAQRIYLST